MYAPTRMETSNKFSLSQEQGSVMSHSETALRDPIFYRWHVFIDDIFQSYKRTLPAYTYEEVRINRTFHLYFQNSHTEQAFSQLYRDISQEYKFKMSK